MIRIMKCCKLKESMVFLEKKRINESKKQRKETIEKKIKDLQNENK